MQEELDTVELQQQFFPIFDFHAIMDKWSDLLDHNPQKNIYTADNAYHYFEFVYQVLGDDVLVLHQKTYCHTKHRMELLPRKEGKYYTLKCSLDQSKTARLISENQHYDIYQGTLGLFSNYANYIAELPKGYYEENLQIIISHKFIEEYINPQNISHSQLQKIIEGCNDLLFILSQSPAFIKNQMNQLAFDMDKVSAGKTVEKLQLLKTVSSVLERLFQVKATTDIDSLAIDIKENTARKVAAYLDDSIATSFPGMDFLAATFGISVSGLKRHFKREFNTTPFQYHRRKKMQLACEKLKESELTVTEIAFQLGFNNPSNFIRAFKAEVDTTPGRYREFNVSM